MKNADNTQTNSKWAKYLPWLAAGVALIGALGGLFASPQVRKMDVQAFATLPVLEGGRVKPLDSIARNSLEITCRPEGEMYAQPAVLRKLTHEETEQLRAQGMAPIVPRPYDPRVVPSTQEPLKARQTDKRGGLR